MYLEVDKITKNFGEVTALCECSLNLRQGEWFGILGPSGCGKTTLLRIIAGLEEADSGTISLNSELLSDRKHVIPPEKRGIGFVFQSLALWPHMSAVENVAFMFSGKVKKGERRKRARQLLSDVHLPNSLHDSYPDELSGGECQRVAIARALATDPRLLLMDEPFSHLDSVLKQEMFSLMNELRKNKELTVIYVSHMKEELEAIVDQIGRFDNYELIFPQDLITKNLILHNS